MSDQKIGFIGAGNMARSIIGGLVTDGCDVATIWVSDRDSAQLETLRQRIAVNVTTSNIALVEQVDVVVLAVKPQMLQVVAEEIGGAVQTRQPLLISIAAGIREAALNRWLGGGVAIVRCMPNTPALIRTGATALYANTRVSSAQCSLAESLMRAVGLALWLEDEGQMDAVTALSGSGPAYYFLVMEAMEAAAQKLGLPAEVARLLTLETAFGATKMALESSESCATLRSRVTSPGGTTERALHCFEEGQLRELFYTAMSAAAERSGELAQQLGGEST